MRWMLLDGDEAILRGRVGWLLDIKFESTAVTNDALNLAPVEHVLTTF